jgi:hypothetical protein
MSSHFRMRDVLGGLAGWQVSILVGLLSIDVVAALVHLAIVAYVSRLRPGASAWNRMAPFGFGSWHIGVLRRSWYPNEATHLRRWVLLTWVISMGSLLAVWLLIGIWVV